MEYIIYFTLSCLGVTLIITKSSIFAPLRDLMHSLSPNFFGVLFSCPTCMGFWAGFIISFFVNPFADFSCDIFIIDKLLIGATSSFLCTFFINGVLDFFYSLSDFLEGSD